MIRLTKFDRVNVIRCLVEGNSIRSTVRITGIAKNTVATLLVDMGIRHQQFDKEARG